MKRILGIVALLFAFSAQVLAQCAMCKASAETSMEAGSTEAAGINAGVLYVLVITFGMLSFFGYLLYSGNKATREV